MIGIIDYGCGNILAISNVYKRLKIQTKIVSNISELDKSITRLILPGVGAFDEAVSKLKDSGLIDKLNEAVIEQRLPVLGICVGMQIMSKASEEGALEGLNWIPGNVKRFDDKLFETYPKTPHMGWNEINLLKDCKLFEGIDKERGFYFIHSYYYECLEKKNSLAKTFYGNEFDSAVNLDNIYGVQFHPEKSHSNGITLFKNFSEL